MRNSVVLNQVFEDPVCAILFEMEYVVSVPIPVPIPSTPGKSRVPATKRQHETHHLLVRWAAYSPFAAHKGAALEAGARCDLALLGGSAHDSLSPEFKLVYSKPDTDMHDRQASVSAPGKLSFRIKAGDQISFERTNLNSPSEVSNSQVFDKHHQHQHQQQRWVIEKLAIEN
jgi:hypothetical protein